MLRNDPEAAVMRAETDWALVAKISGDFEAVLSVFTRMRIEIDFAIVIGTSHKRHPQ
jgi:hypothetical protein